MASNTEWELYEKKFSADGETNRESTLSDLKTDFIETAVDSPSYTEDSTRNGVEQHFLLTEGNTRYKGQLVAFPDEELYAGDVIYARGEQWLVTETSYINPMQRTAVVWMCNKILRFQDGTGRILETPAVVDGGTHTMDLQNNNFVSYIDSDKIIYLPYNDDTKKLYEGKRLAIGYKYDDSGTEILDTVTVGSVFYNSCNYGEGSHLLVLACNTSQYSVDKDSMSECICDYIEHSIDTVKTTDDKILLSNDIDSGFEGRFRSEIKGRKTISPGITREYRACFYDESGVNITTAEVHPIWDYSIDGIVLGGGIRSDILTLTLPDDESLIGSKITINLTTEESEWASTVMEVEVISVG